MGGTPLDADGRAARGAARCLLAGRGPSSLAAHPHVSLGPRPGGRGGVRQPPRVGFGGSVGFGAFPENPSWGLGWAPPVSYLPLMQAAGGFNRRYRLWV